MHRDYKELAKYETLHVGQLVVIAKDEGWGPVVKVHWFNRKGVFVGNHYEFFDYDLVYLHPKGKVFSGEYNKPWAKGFKKIKANLKQWLFERLCRFTTRMIKLTYRD